MLSGGETSGQLPPALLSLVVKKLDRDGDGKLTKKDAEIVAAGNTHGAVGGTAGFIAGFVKGVGL